VLHSIENYTLTDCTVALSSPWICEARKDQIKVQVRRLKALENHWSLNRNIIK